MCHSVSDLARYMYVSVPEGNTCIILSHIIFYLFFVGQLRPDWCKQVTSWQMLRKSGRVNTVHTKILKLQLNVPYVMHHAVRH